VRAWLRDAAGGLPGTYWFLWAGLLINRVGGFAVLFLSLYLTAQRGASPALAGLIVGTYGITRRSTRNWTRSGCAAATRRCSS